MSWRPFKGLLLLVLAAAAVHYYQVGWGGEGGLKPTTQRTAASGVDEANATLTRMEAWLVRDLNGEGFFDYQYFPSNGSRSGDNNMIRQLMASRTLAELAGSDERLMDLHRRNMDYAFASWYRSDGERGYIFYDNDSRLGANGMALRAISHSPYFGKYRDKAEALKRTIISLQNPNGSFRPYYVEPWYPYDSGYVLSFYSGEAILGLLDYYSRTGDRESFEAAVRAQDYYIGEYVERMGDNYCPFYVPWHTMTLYRLYNITGERRYAEAAFKMNDRLVASQEPGGRFFDRQDMEYGQPYSAVTALDVDGLTYAYELAVRFNDTERVGGYGSSMMLGAKYLSGLQYMNMSDSTTYGALRADSDCDMVRVDATQHAADAFTRIVGIYSLNPRGFI